MIKRMYNIIWGLITNKEDLRKELQDFSEEDLFVVEQHLIDIDRKIERCNPDFDRMWDTIKRETISKKRATLNIFLKYAASLVVLVGLSLLSYYIYDTSSIEANNRCAYENSLEGDVAKLLLAGGEKIDLSKLKTDRLINDNSLVVKNDPNKMLEYEKKSEYSNKSEYNTVVVPRAGEYTVKLSDGTIVNMNSETVLRYPAPFEKGRRNVYLERGQAFFKVSKDKSRPFIVHVNGVKVKVHGTSFDVNAYEETNGILTTLVEGSVEVITEDKSIFISPDEQAMVSKEKGIVVNKVDAKQYITWNHGYLKFDNAPLEKLMIKLERWFDVEVVYLNPELKKYRYTGTINRYYSLDKMLKIIEEVLSVKITVKDKKLYIKEI